MVEFDPYHKWLGIPREEQPANHYRLLGITLFEADPDVIEAAADRQMKYVAQCVTGRYVRESQQLLNELAAAKVCLLVPARRKVYDAELRRKQDEAQRLERSMVPLALNEPEMRSETEATGSERFPEVKPRQAAPPPRLKVRKAKTSSSRGPVKAAWPVKSQYLLAILAVVLLAGGFGLLSMLPKGRRASEGARLAERSTVAEMEPAQPATTAPPTAESSESPSKEESVPIVDVVPVRPLPAARGAQTVVPGLPEQDAARKVVLDQFKAEFTAAKTPAASVELAQVLAEKSETANDDATRFVMLTEALTLAVNGDDFDVANEVLKLLARRFRVDPLVWRARAAISLGAIKRALTPAEAAVLFQKFSDLANEAAAVDEYAMAADVMQAAVARLPEPGQQALRDDASFLLKHFEAWRDAFAATKDARDRLLKDQTDPDANLSWGRFVCFYKQDWEAGLALLARGNDATWAPLARRQLEPPTSAPEWLALGDAWRAAGADEVDPIRKLAADAADQAWQRAVETASDVRQKKIEQDVDQRTVNLFGQSFVTTKGDAIGSSIANSEPFSPNGAFTIEFWVSTTAAKGTLLSKRHQSGQSSIIVHLHEGIPNLSIAIGGGERGSGAGAEINDGKWHHIALVKRQDLITLFVDGNRTVQTEESSDLSSPAPWKFGCSDNRPSCAARFGGVRISQVARYDGPFVPKKLSLSDRDTLLRQ